MVVAIPGFRVKSQTSVLIGHNQQRAFPNKTIFFLNSKTFSSINQIVEDVESALERNFNEERVAALSQGLN